MIRTAATLVAAVALVVAAAALVVSAWSAYRVAEAEEEQACWAWISATADTGQVMTVTADALLTLDAQIYSNEDREQRWEEKITAFEKMFDVCEAL
ncbi:MAG: hypothetical protein HOI99_07915 [Actinobacteria bacterium]|nr:hypothetical protein [Actinomycetota bacterium]